MTSITHHECWATRDVDLNKKSVTHVVTLFCYLCGGTYTDIHCLRSGWGAGFSPADVDNGRAGGMTEPKPEPTLDPVYHNERDQRMGHTALESIAPTAGWIAVVSTITASTAAYLFANWMNYLILSYKATARKLEDRLAFWFALSEDERDHAAFKKLTADCEQTISIENTAWMAELSNREATTPSM